MIFHKIPSRGGDDMEVSPIFAPFFHSVAHKVIHRLRRIPCFLADARRRFAPAQRASRCWAIIDGLPLNPMSGVLSC